MEPKSHVNIGTLLTDLSRAYIHKETKNTSFLHMSKYLRENGIKNNKFMLVLYDKTLKDVDVHSKHLTPGQKARIHAEIMRNPWFYLREVARISTPAGKSRVKIHPGNMALIWSIINSLNTIVELPRQQFKTVSICGILTWFYDFVCENTAMYFGNKSIIDSKNNLKRFKDIRGNHPEWLKNKLFAKGDIDNQESILSVTLNNKIDIHGNPTNADKADLMGRGMSIPILWEDE